MPVAMRTTYQKAEAKYNVTTEFPSLGLHSAAATGNVGLVEYALVHGQPINSVLDGVLPLHAACAGGNVQVVKLLIDNGADVNAPRLPRRFSNDKNRDSSAPIVGTSGSTPLHFAAANGNTEAVNLLLLHGAHADRPDKHGITPEMLARQHGWLECAEVLKQWLINKDRDLKERPGGGEDLGSNQTRNTSRERIGSFSGESESSQTTSNWRRIQVKHSISRLKHSGTDSKSFTSTPPSSPTRPFGDYTSMPISDEAVVDLGLRRPSLPHISEPSTIPLRSRKTSTPTSNNSPSPRRPRSAGNGAEGKEEIPNSPPGRTAGIKKLGSKYSLKNIFKKGQAGELLQPADGSQPVSTSPSLTNALSPPITSNASIPSSPPRPSADSFNLSTYRPPFRLHRGSDASTRATSQPIAQQTLQKPSSANMPSPPLTTAVDFHNALAQEQQERRHQQTRDRSRSASSGTRFNPDDHNGPSPGSSPISRLDLLRAQGHRRDRSGSGCSLGSASGPSHRSGAVFDDDVVITPNEGGIVDPERSGNRPSILRVHARTSSSGHVPGTPGFRALRFDSSSSVSNGTRREGDGLKATPILRTSNSVGSLGRYKKYGDVRRETTPEPRVSEENLSPESAPADVSELDAHSNNDNGEIRDDEDEEEYGQPLNREESPIADPNISKTGTLLLRQRGRSFASSSQSSLSPIMANEVQDSSLINAEFPFSIDKPLVLYTDETETSVPTDYLRVPSSGSNRNRGDSVSSTSTTDSQNPQLSHSGTTCGSGSETVTTPWFSSPGREKFLEVRTDSSPRNIPHHLEVGDANETDTKEPTNAAITTELEGITTTPTERRRHTPSNIDINSISSHAQAEALVLRAQMDILQMAQSNELTPPTESTGRSPLSARLAAYGESLALARKLKEQAEERKVSNGQPNGGELPHPKPTIPKNHISKRNGVERQHSLEHRNRPRPPSKTKDPKRPSTAEGQMSSGSSEQTRRFHQSSHSAIEFGVTPTSRLSIEQEAVSSDEDTLSAHTHSKSATIPLAARRDFSPAPRIVRSRTPVPSTGGQLSRISSHEGIDTDTDLGPSLLRVSTAPHAPTRGSKSSTTKLARMGFPPLEQARAPTPTNKRFGGTLRSWVQNLKGKP